MQRRVERTPHVGAARPFQQKLHTMLPTQPDQWSGSGAEHGDASHGDNRREDSHDLRGGLHGP